jgi:hypothetical protein
MLWPDGVVHGVLMRQLEQIWSQPSFGKVDLDILTDFVRELAVLARTAGERGERLYCWVCV